MTRASPALPPMAHTTEFDFDWTLLYTKAVVSTNPCSKTAWDSENPIQQNISLIGKKKQYFCTIMATGSLLQPKALKVRVCGHYRSLPSKFTKSQSLGNLLGRGLKRWPPSMYFISMLTFKEVEAIQLNIVYENTCLVVL